MKILFRFLAGFLAVAACWGAGYLIGSFIFVSFNPNEWDIGGRVLLAFFSTVVAFPALMAAVTL